MAKESLSGFIKASRVKRGLRQVDVSKHLGFTSPQFISNWERGVSKPPLKYTKKLCNYLDIPKPEFKKILISTYTDEVSRAIGKGN